MGQRRWANACLGEYAGTTGRRAAQPGFPSETALDPLEAAAGCSRRDLMADPRGNRGPDQGARWTTHERPDHTSDGTANTSPHRTRLLVWLST